MINEVSNRFSLLFFVIFPRSLIVLSQYMFEVSMLNCSTWQSATVGAETVQQRFYSKFGFEISLNDDKMMVPSTPYMRVFEI